MKISTIFRIKMAHLSWKKFFWYKPLLLLSSTYWPFSLRKIQKILTVDPELWQCTIFGSKMLHLSQTNLSLKNYYCHSHLPISPFLCAKFKKTSSSRFRVMRMSNFWVQNDSFPQIRVFSENLFRSLVSFIHAYLHAKNQSQILIY